ncbi:phosphoribosyltransferase [Natronospira bacteriovora]|uniref:Phosphoribosyltransferase family protein n=1 Tax=Natronospira bacteriovora TaxID=3069753 RepID=A0ABU0W5J3_9GAMM|nr:phosphoribosyltransferase family protein [Natronospira sp. AB-CW4]MDQ2069043.1 phosphoribosyltransferase family protein [Natronospira sp. AB-CW4]
MFELFENREQAGRALAAALAHHRDEPDLLVLGLARGGMPVAAPVADELGADLDVVVVRKIRAPHQPELAIGAVGPDGVRVLNNDIIAHMDISPAAVVHATHKAREEQKEREQLYRDHRPAIAAKGRTVIIVDDGLATGASLEAAIAWARNARAGKIIAATPVAAAEARQRLAKKVDEFVSLKTPWDFQAVSRWYRVFDQTGDDEVSALLAQATRRTIDPENTHVGQREHH